MNKDYLNDNIKLNFDLFKDLEITSYSYKNSFYELIKYFILSSLKILKNKIKLGILGCGLLGGTLLNRIYKDKDLMDKIEWSISSRNYEEINKTKFKDIFLYYDNFKLFMESNILILTISKHNIEYIIKDLFKNKESLLNNKLIIVNLANGLNTKKLKNYLNFFKNILKFKIITPKINYKEFETIDLIEYKKNISDKNKNILNEINLLIDKTYKNILKNENLIIEWLKSFLFLYKKENLFLTNNNTNFPLVKEKEKIKINNNPIKYLKSKEWLFKFIFPSENNWNNNKKLKNIKENDLNKNYEDILLNREFFYKLIDFIQCNNLKTNWENFLKKINK